MKKRNLILNQKRIRSRKRQLLLPLKKRGMKKSLKAVS